MVEKIITNSAKETKETALKMAKRILNKKIGKRAVILTLKGNLGAGKTTFVQGFAKGLGIKGKVLSPTFNIMKRFKLKSVKYDNFYHIDCYRLHSKKDLEVLGFKEVILDPRNIIALEWPEKVKGINLKGALEIKFKHLKGNKRSLVIKR